MNNISIHIHFVKAVIKNATLRGYDTERLLKRSRISPYLLQQQQARVSAEQYARIQTVTMREMRDEMLGYCTKPLKLGQWSALCHWLIQCKTLGQAINRYCLFYEILERGLAPKLVYQDSHVCVEFTAQPEDETTLEPYAYEFSTFSFHRFMCWLIGFSPLLKEVTLSYPQPEHFNEYRPLFLGAPTQFGSSKCSIVFDRTLLEKPVIQTPETLDSFLRNPLYNILVNNYQSTSWTQRIKDLIGKDLSHLPSYLEITKTLNINPKRLRRYLNQEGLSYHELKLQLRRDTAIHHLSKQDTSVEEIAFKTGFSEASAFIRAFKKWTGVTPYTYRKNIL
jgi:AraC-like DNA-binding protein